MGRVPESGSDPLTAARVRDALVRAEAAAQGDTGAMAGCRALPRERDLAAHLEKLYPGLGRMLLAAVEFHRRAALWAALGGDDAFPVAPAEGIIICDSGFRCPGEALHARALAAAPGTRAVYCDSSPQVAAANMSGLAAQGQVAVTVARGGSPESVLGSVPVARLTAHGPVSLHLVVSPGRWAPGEAEEAVAGYGRRLPPGSVLCMSLVIPDREPCGDLTAGGDALTEAASLAGSPAYPHTAQDVAGWFKAAGLLLHPGGVAPVRAFGAAWARPYKPAPEVPGWMTAAVGLVP